MTAADAHSEAIARMTGKFVPVAEALMPIVRKPLAEILTSRLSGIDQSLAVDPKAMMKIYGVPLTDGQAEKFRPLAENARALRLGGVKALVDGLDAAVPLSITKFVDELMKDIAGALDQLEQHTEGTANPCGTIADDTHPDVATVARELDISVRDLEAMVRGEAAFRCLVSFLSYAYVIVRRAKPQSIVDLRSAQPN